MEQQEILFRGKRVDNGKWIEGQRLEVDDKIYIIDFDYEDHPEINGSPRNWWTYYKQVIPETVGQYVWEKYPDGSKMFQGDLLKIIDSKDTFKVIFDKNGFCALQIWDEWLGIDVSDRCKKNFLVSISTFKIEKTGTIHD